MSRVGKEPIDILEGVTVNIEEKDDGSLITVKGAKDSLSLLFRKEIKFKKEENRIVLERSNNEKSIKSLHGAYRALLNNMMIGVKEGFTKELTWTGVGTEWL